MYTVKRAFLYVLKLAFILREKRSGLCDRLSLKSPCSGEENTSLRRLSLKSPSSGEEMGALRPFDLEVSFFGR